MNRIAPLIRACGDRFPSRYDIVSMRVVVAGASGKVIKLEVGAAPEESLPPGLVQCMGAAFEGVRLQPFERPEFSYTFPFKLTD